MELVLKKELKKGELILLCRIFLAKNLMKLFETLRQVEIGEK